MAYVHDECHRDMLKVMSEYLACDGLVMRVVASASQGSVMRWRNRLVSFRNVFDRPLKLGLAKIETSTIQFGRFTR